MKEEGKKGEGEKEKMPYVKGADLKYLKKIALVLVTSILLSILLVASTSSPVLAKAGELFEDPLGTFNGTFTTGGAIRSSAAIADLDGDGWNDTVIGSSDGKVYAFSVREDRELWNFTTGGTIYYSSPVIINLTTKNNRLVVVVGANNCTTGDATGVNKTYVLNGTTGKELRNFSTGGYMESSTAIVRLNEWKSNVSDDDFVALIGSYDNRIRAFRINVSAPKGERFTPYWNIPLDGQIWASPAIGDITGNGKPEVLVGTRNGKLYVLNHTGGILKIITRGGMIMSSPAIGNIDGDPENEVVFGGSFNGKVYAANGTPRVEWIYKIGVTSPLIMSSPKIADLDNDTHMEVVIASYDGHVYALNGSTGVPEPGWPSTTGGPIRSSAAIADLDDDGYKDVVIGSLDYKLYVFNGSDGSESWNFTTGGEIWSSPAIADVNNDGIEEVIIGSADGKVYVIDPNGKSIDDGCSEWRMFGGNLKHTNYIEISPVIEIEAVAVEAEIDIDPDTLNLKSKGKWITCYIELPEGYDVVNIDVDSIRLQEQDELVVEHSDVQDGVLMVKFNRQDVIAYIESLDLELPVDGTLTVTGELTDGTPFEGTDTIRVISKGGRGIAKLKRYIVSLWPMR